MSSEPLSVDGPFRNLPQVGDPSTRGVVEWQYEDRRSVIVTPMCLDQTLGHLTLATVRMAIVPDGHLYFRASLRA